MIEWARIADLRADVGAEAFSEVIEIFLEEVDEIVGGLQARSDPAEMREALHFLKGSALNLGFSALAGHCTDGELRVQSGQPFDCAALIECYHLSRAKFLGRVSSQRTPA